MANKTISIDLLIQTAKSVKSTEAQKSVLLDIYEALKNVEQGSTAFDALSQSADSLKKALGGVDAKFEDLYGDLQPLSSRLREMEDRMYEMALAGHTNTQEFRDLQAEAIKFRSTIIDVDASVDAFSKKGGRLQGFIGTLSGVAGGFAVIQGSMALLGSENEDLEKGLLKVQSSLAVLNGLQEINRLITEKNVVVQGILNVVMKANPIFILLGVLAAVTAAWAIFGKKTKEITKDVEALKDTNDELNKSFTSSISLIDKEILLYKSLGKSTADLVKKKEDLLKSRKREIDTSLSELSTQVKVEAKIAELQKNKETLAKSTARFIDIDGKVRNEQYLNDQIKLNKEELALILDLKEKSLDIEIFFNDKISDEKTKVSDNNVGELERQKALLEANGKETIKLELAIIEEKKKLYKVDSEAYRDLINQKKILDIEYNKTLKEKLQERRKLWADAIADISAFNIQQGFTIDEETIQAYSDSVYKIVELRKFQGDQAKREIEEESREVLTALREELTELKKLGKLKVNEARLVQAQIDLVEANKEARIIQNTTRTEKEITDIIREEAKQRKALIAEYTGEILSTTEFKRYQQVTENALNKQVKLRKEIFDKETYNISADIRAKREQADALVKIVYELEDLLSTQKELDKQMLLSGEIMSIDPSKYLKVQNEINLSKRAVLELDEVVKKLYNTKPFASADYMASITATLNLQTGISQNVMDSVRNVISTSIGESTEAMDLLTKIYNSKGALIVEETDAINRELAKITGDEFDKLKAKLNLPLEVTTIKFAIEPVDGEIGIEQLLDINTAITVGKTLFKTLGDALKDEYEKLNKSETESFNATLFSRYGKYKEDIEQVALTEEEKSIIRKEYIEDTEKIQEDHADKLILIDLAYGKVSQADLVAYFKKKNATLEVEAQKEIALKQQLNDQLLTLEQQLQDATLSLYNNMIDQKLRANDLLYENTISHIDAEEQAYNEQFVKRTAIDQAKYDAGLAFDAKRANAERKRQLEEDKLQKKRFNAQKINDATGVTINTAVAVTKTIAQLGGVGAITPPGIALIAAIMAGGVIQNATILGQKYIPQYAKGGLVKGAGTGTSDSIDAKLSNGEVVINAKSVQKFAPLLDAINQAGGGVAIPYTNKPMVKSVENSTEYNFERLEGAILSLNDRPIETYVTESSITNAQMKAKKLKSRTSF